MVLLSIYMENTDKSTVLLQKSTISRLKEQKIVKKESYDEVINRLMDKEGIKVIQDKVVEDNSQFPVPLEQFEEYLIEDDDEGEEEKDCRDEEKDLPEKLGELMI